MAMRQWRASRKIAPGQFWGIAKPQMEQRNFFPTLCQLGKSLCVILRAKLLRIRPGETGCFGVHHTVITDFGKTPTKQREPRIDPKLLSVLLFQVPTVKRTPPPQLQPHRDERYLSDSRSSLLVSAVNGYVECAWQQQQ